MVSAYHGFEPVRHHALSEVETSRAAEEIECRSRMHRGVVNVLYRL